MQRSVVTASVTQADFASHWMSVQEHEGHTLMSTVEAALAERLRLGPVILPRSAQRSHSASRVANMGHQALSPPCEAFQQAMQALDGVGASATDCRSCQRQASTDSDVEQSQHNSSLQEAHVLPGLLTMMQPIAQVMQDRHFQLMEAAGSCLPCHWGPYLVLRCTPISRTAEC